MNFIVQILNIYIENVEPHKHVAQIRKKIRFVIHILQNDQRGFICSAISRSSILKHWLDILL